MGAQQLNARSVRRIARSTGLDVIRGWSHGGYVMCFVTAGHQHGWWNKKNEEWGFDCHPVHYTSCRQLFPGEEQESDVIRQDIARVRASQPLPSFRGVLGVLHKATADGRMLSDPGSAISRPLPLSLRFFPAGGMTGLFFDVGVITDVRIDGGLIRYSGRLNAGGSQFVEGIESGQLVSVLDAESCGSHDWWDWEEDSEVLVMRGWRVMGATLMPSEKKAWPEVTMSIDPEVSP